MLCMGSEAIGATSSSRRPTNWATAIELVVAQLYRHGDL